METFGLSFNHLPIVNKKKVPKVEYEYQALGVECEEYFGKDERIWMQFSRKGVTENLIRYALKECKTRNKPFVPYFLKIINNKIKK